MRKIFIHSTILLAIALCSCDPCRNLDCVSSNYYGQFRIVNKLDGRDLLFGPNRIYDATKIKFYSVTGNDTTRFEAKPMGVNKNGYDSILHVTFFPETAVDVYMKLNDVDTDTLQLTRQSYHTKCCGTVTEITNFRYNNSVNIPGTEGAQEIRK